MKENIEIIGIVLNFVAGFLIGPDLIGEKRINSYELKFGNWLRRVDSRVSQYENRLESIHKAILVRALIIYIGVLITYNLITILLDKQLAVLGTLLAILAPAAFLLAFYLYIISILRFTMKFLHGTTAVFLRIIRFGLSKGVVILGIALYILGNLMQLVAKVRF